MKELAAKVIRSDHSFNIKMLKKHKNNYFHIDNNRDCDSTLSIDNRNFLNSKLILALILFALVFEVCGDDSRVETTTKCPNCQIKDSRYIAYVNLQNKILDALGYHDGPPKNSHKERRTFLPLLSKFVEMYRVESKENHVRHHSNEVEDQPPIQLQEELSQGEPCPHCMKFDGIHTPIIFKLDNSTGKTDNYKGVSLMLYVNNSEHCQESITVNIYQLIYPDPPGRKEYIQIKTTERNPDRDSMIYIDVRHDVENNFITTAYTNNITFVIDLSYRNKNAINCPDLSKDMAFHALLKFQYGEKLNRRLKRTAPKLDCNETQNYRDCCRYPLTIDFDDMQWDFIITPRRYEAYHCAGECPFLYKHSLPHTHLAQQMKARGGPCCSPKKMSPITMLYFTPRGTILYGKLGGMVVDTCGCS